jgi:hypothetical protein
MRADVADGSKPVKLNPSRCFPLYFEKQTYRRSPEEQSPRAAAAERPPVNARGIATARGEQWYAQSVANILERA